MSFIKASIFVVISVLVVALVYSSFSAFYTTTFYVFAAPPSFCFENECPGYRDCSNNPERGTATCCWGGTGADYCQTCEVNTQTGDFENCSEVGAAPPTPTPFAPEGALPQGEVQQLPPTPPPTGGKGLFGSEVLPTPPAGLAPPTTTATPSPSPQTTPPPTTGLKGPQGQLMAPEGGVLPPQSPAGGGEQGQSRIFDSPTGGCIPYIRNNCVPCDPGLPGGDCMPSSDWPPPRTTDEGGSLVTPTPTVSPGKPLIGELTPEGGGTQPETQPDESEEGGEGPPVEQPEGDGQEEPSNQGQDITGPLT